ncbi:hypothetical protein EGR_11197 [Echinococcus granulosus]|uniref:Uncharacterized protein n=1 Tax=Echinococcus granulosus TaxID=6210 RepID=W6U0J6_ECHGR|nr:hypothetical protein EGR_11197 [Echinococcus granulosus]EUB53946.1 hypothetical protein EGR_11197 [Echinococcus granulosus]
MSDDAPGGFGGPRSRFLSVGEMLVLVTKSPKRPRYFYIHTGASLIGSWLYGSRQQTCDVSLTSSLKSVPIILALPKRCRLICVI